MDGSPGHVIREDDQIPINPGNYIVLDRQNRSPSTVQLTSEGAPRRVTTQDQSSRSQGRSKKVRLQSRFRRSLCARDAVCAISNNASLGSNANNPYLGLHASHIFPTSQLSEWEQNNYRRYITDTGPVTQIGRSRLYSAQNGLLLDATVHEAWDGFVIGVDRDADYRIIVFGGDPTGLGGTRLRNTARHGTTANNRVSADLLRWHLRMCVYSNMRANADPGPVWEEDLGSDDMGQILEQPDAGERMEVELFTRLGELVA